MSAPFGLQRRARRHMDHIDWINYLARVADNAAWVTARAARENKRYSALAVYLAQGMDTETALRTWMADNPGQELP
jgi:hypothetical protein